MNMDFPWTFYSNTGFIGIGLGISLLRLTTNLIMLFVSYSLILFNKPSVIFGIFCGVVVITTAQLHSTKPELRFCTGSNSARGVSEICNGEDLWQWSQLEIRLNSFRQSTIPQKQFIIIITITASLSFKASLVRKHCQVHLQILFHLCSHDNQHIILIFFSKWREAALTNPLLLPAWQILTLYFYMAELIMQIDLNYQTTTYELYCVSWTMSHASILFIIFRIVFLNFY